MESFKYCMEIESNELNSASEQLHQLPDCFFKPSWENSMDQSDPFESALSSIVSSPAASNAPAIAGSGTGDSFMIRELIGRLGNICNSGEISPQSYMCSNSNSTNTSCYGTPLNSPPKLNLSMADPQIRANLQINGSHLPTPPPSLAPFSGDPGFAERAAKFSCFGSRSFNGVNGQFGLNEAELPFRLMPRTESNKLSRALSNQPLRVGTGSQTGVQESNKGSTQNGNSASDKKSNRVSRSSTPENGDSREGSSVSDQIPSGESSGKAETEANARKRKSILRGKAKETPSSPSVKDVKVVMVAVENDQSNAKRSKKDGASAGNEKDAPKTKVEADEGKASGDGNQKQTKENSKPPEPPKDYIHVRARRGQATDSHSLAERVRREKISERMKFLQDLVPGCNKVTGKAVMLDEIINYVQSLQRQVEFLSMKLATVNPRMDFNMEALLSKDIFQSRGSLPHALYPLDSSLPAFPFGYHPQQVPQLNNGISTATTETQFPVNPLNASLHRTPNIQLPTIDGFAEAALQVSTFFEDDLQSVVQMGFGQIQQQTFQGSMPTTAQMKVEL